jgi:hypothetical protein
MAGNSYKAGTCNIGNAEIKRRKSLGIVFLIISCVLIVILFVFSQPKFYRMLSTVPLFISALGFLQAKSKFCAYFGIIGLENFKNLGKEQKIIIAEYKRKDRMRSLKLIIQSLLISVIVSSIVYVL